MAVSILGLKNEWISARESVERTQGMPGHDKMYVCGLIQNKRGPVVVMQS